MRKEDLELIRRTESVPANLQDIVAGLVQRMNAMQRIVSELVGDIPPCPCGDNDGMHCSLKGCPYPTPREARASGLPHEERLEIDDDELELARVEYLYAKAELADLEALRAHDEYKKRKATRDECRRRGISVPKHLR